jgi:serine/threonine-protein phosphatase 2A regulatory subunit B''
LIEFLTSTPASLKAKSQVSCLTRTSFVYLSSSLETFAGFVLSEEDKTTNQAIDYWFNLVDLASDGVISGSEMNHFYSEQQQRLDYLGQEVVKFEDLVCQMMDAFGMSEEKIEFKRQDLKNKRHHAPVFFNSLTNLNKFIAYEQRDPFQARNEKVEFPDYSDWDKFALVEYRRLAAEEENIDNVN